MSYTIVNSKCISCDRCLVQCPQRAITKRNSGLAINSSLCNNCQNSYNVAQCAAVCPANACFPSLDTNNYWENWFTRYERTVSQLKNQQNPDYWLNWFAVYSQKLTQLVN